MKEAVLSDQQNESANMSSFNKTPITLLYEYATKNHLTPEYHLIYVYQHFSKNKLIYKYNLKFDGYEKFGEGNSKREAKHDAAFNVLNEMIKDKPELLKTYFKQLDFEKNIVSPYDNSIKVNFVGKLHEMCTNNALPSPEFKLVREEGPAHAKLFTMSCQVSEIIETATHKTKKQAKHSVSDLMIKRLSIDKSLVLDSEVQESKSMKVSEQVEMNTINLIKKPPINEDISNQNLLFKQIDWLNSDTLRNIIKQYNHDGKLDIINTYDHVKDIAQECGMLLVEKCMDKKNLIDTNNNICILTIENVYPQICGTGIADNAEAAKNLASSDLLENICLLSK